MNRKPALFIVVVLVLAVAATLILKNTHIGGANGESSKGRTGEGAVLPRLVDLGSDKCIPCKMMAPILEELQRDYQDMFLVDVIDVRKNRDAATPYGVRVIPTQIFFDSSGSELFRHEGFFSKEDILAKWEELGVDVGSDYSISEEG